MSERKPGAPKSAEHKASAKETEARAKKPAEYFKKREDYFANIESKRSKLAESIAKLEAADLDGKESDEVLAHGRDLKELHDKQEAFNKSYKAMGGEKLDEMRKRLEENPDDTEAKQRIEEIEAYMHESYLNKVNEYAQLSNEDRNEFISMVMDDLPEEDDPQYYEKIAELQETWLMGMGSMTRSQAERVVDLAQEWKEARKSREKMGEAPTGLPTSAEAEAAARAVEDEPVRANIFARAWDAVNVKLGNGMYRFGEILSRKKYEGERRKPGETDEAYEKRMKRKGTIATLTGVAIGAAFLGYKAAAVRGWMSDGIEGSFGSGGTGGSAESLDGVIDAESGTIGTPNRVRGLEEYPTIGGEGAGSDDSTHEAMSGGSLGTMEMLDEASRVEASANLGGVDTFDGTMFDGYNPMEDAFNMPGKTGEVNWGAPLPTELTAGAHFDVAGLDELVSQSWSDSPEQLATVAAEFGLDGFDTGNIEMMAEQMKSDPGFAHDTYMQMLEQLNGSNIRISEGEPLLPGTYGSYYESMVDGNGVISYDHVVNEPGTTIKFELLDKDGNVVKVIETKRECGGQIIHRHAVGETVPMGGAAPVSSEAAPVATTEHTPIGGGEYTPPQGGGTPEVPFTPPETPEIPITPETPIEPEVPPVIEELVPKDPTLDINVNPDLPEQLQMGDQAGTIEAGEYDPAPVAPPEVYEPPAAPEVSTEVVPDATPVDRGESAPAVPAPEAGVNPGGDTGGSGGGANTGRVEG